MPISLYFTALPMSLICLSLPRLPENGKDWFPCERAMSSEDLPFKPPLELKWSWLICCVGSRCASGWFSLYIDGDIFQLLSPYSSYKILSSSLPSTVGLCWVVCFIYSGVCLLILIYPSLAFNSSAGTINKNHGFSLFPLLTEHLASAISLSPATQWNEWELVFYWTHPKMRYGACW